MSYVKCDQMRYGNVSRFGKNLVNYVVGSKTGMNHPYGQEETERKSCETFINE